MPTDSDSAGRPSASASAPDVDALWRDESHWNGGMLYFCKEDPRFVVPKSLRWTGWTVNFAHPWAPAALVAVIVLPPLLAAMPRAAALARRSL